MTEAAREAQQAAHDAVQEVAQKATDAKATAEASVQSLAELQARVSGIAASQTVQGEDLAKLTRGMGDLQARVDQLRAIFGLNGSTSVEEVKAAWGDLAAVIRRDRDAMARKQAREMVWEEVSQTLHLRRLGGFLRWAVPLLAGALAWKVVNYISVDALMHWIQTHL